MKKRTIALLFVAAAAAVATGGMLLKPAFSPKPVIIDVALYSGNSWGVPQNFAYAIYDKAAEMFESRERSVPIKIRYRTGTMYKDYSEWFGKLLLKGQEPDCFLIIEEDFNTYASIGFLENLDPYIMRNEDFDTSTFYPQALNAGTFHGSQFSLPISIVPSFMIYNRTLLEKEGIRIDEEHWDWDQFHSICSRLTRDTDGDGVIDQFGEYGYDWHHAFYTSDYLLFEENGSKIGYNAVRMGETVDHLKGLYRLRKGSVVTEKDFDKGRVGFKPFNFSEYKAYSTYPYRILKYEAFEWEALPFPTGPRGLSASKLYTVQIGMSSRSDKKKEAFEFMKFITGDQEFQREVWNSTNTLPAHRTVVNRIYEEQEERESVDTVINPGFLETIIAESYTTPDFKLYSFLDDMITQKIFQIVAQNIETRTGVKAMTEDLQRTLKNNRR